MTNTKVELSVSYRNSREPQIKIRGGKHNAGDIEVAPGPGNLIVWKAHDRKKWKFAVLSIDDGEGQFCIEKFSKDRIEMIDHNENNGVEAVEYSYRIAIYDKKRDMVFWTPDPKIINKAPGHM